MSMDMLIACIRGYTDRQIDLQELAIYSGYWSGYYSSNNKRKKPVKTILEMLDKARKGKEGKRAPDVDVEAFLERERKFRERMGGVNDAR